MKFRMRTTVAALAATIALTPVVPAVAQPAGGVSGIVGTSLGVAGGILDAVPGAPDLGGLIPGHRGGAGGDDADAENVPASVRNNTRPLVLLGGRLGNDCTPPGVVKQRVADAAYHSKRSPKSTIYAAGGHTSACPMSEAQKMEQMLRDQGVEARISTENASTTTVENARNVAAMLPKGTRVRIVTSPDHMARAVKAFNNAGLVAEPA